MEFERQRKPEEVIFHSEKGGHYTSKKALQLL
jgi:hypothetical protein